MVRHDQHYKRSLSQTRIVAKSNSLTANDKTLFHPDGLGRSHMEEYTGGPYHSRGVAGLDHAFEKEYREDGSDSN